MHLTGALVDFVEACSSQRPTPGGGAAATLVGALGAALGEMAAAFSSGAGKDESTGDAGAETVRKGLRDLAGLRESLLPLVESDCEAYDKVRAALALPRKESQEKKERTARLQEALKGALEVPLQAARLCRDGLEVLNGMAGALNAHLITDAASSALFLAACYRASWYNVRVNLRSIKDRELKERITAEGEAMAARISDLEQSVLSQADAVLDR